MTNPKRHLIPPHRSAADKAACGLKNPKQWTREPAQVTCAGCSKTVAMADAQVQKQTKKF